MRTLLRGKANIRVFTKVLLSAKASSGQSANACNEPLHRLDGPVALRFIRLSRI